MGDLGSNDCNGLVTALKPGLATIRAKKYDPTVDRTIVSGVSIYVHDSAGIENNTKYYIMNYASGRLLSLEDSSDLPGTNVCTRPRSARTLSQWETSLLSDGRFKLKSVYSTLDQYLDVAGNEVDAFYDFGSDCVKFNIDRVASGMYEGLYLIRYNDQYYVTQDENYNVCITSTPTDKSYWSFMKSNKGSASFYCLDTHYKDDDEVIHNYDVSLHMIDFLAIIDQELEYDAYTYENELIAQNAFNNLNVNDIFIYAGHGSPGTIYFNDEEDNIHGGIIVNSLFFEGLPPNYRYMDDFDDNELANARCVIYMACNTGVDKLNASGDRYNLVDTTFEKGAHFVLGTTKAMHMDSVNNWIEDFLGYILLGYNIEDATCFASEDLGYILVNEQKDDGTSILHWGLPKYCVGDGSQYLSID